MSTPYEKMPVYDSNNSVPVDMTGAGAIRAQQGPQRIRHYFVFSLFSALCLCPATGLIALAYSLKSSAKADVNFHEKARLYSRRALLWNILSVVFVVLFSVMLIVYCNEMMKLYSARMNDVLRNEGSNEMNGEINRMIQSFNNAN